MIQSWIHTRQSCQLMPSRHSQTHQQGGVSWTLKARALSVVAVLFVLGGLFDMTTMAGVGPVEAQTAAGGGQGKLAQTYAIDPASFELVSQAAPAIEVRDGVTIYTLTASGTVSFSALDAGARTIEVDANDLMVMFQKWPLGSMSAMIRLSSQGGDHGAHSGAVPSVSQ